MSLWLLAAACAQYTVVLAQAPTKYNFPEFTGGYQAAGAAANSLAAARSGGYAPAQAGGYGPAPAPGPAPYNAAAVAAGYNYPEFNGGYPNRQPAPAPAPYNPAPAAGYNTAPAAYNPAPAAYNPAPAAGYNPAPAAYNPGPAAGYNSASAGGYNGYGDGSASSGPAQYDYGYASDSSAKKEVRSPDGTVRGAYSYIDANGVTQKVEYYSDATGFHVEGTNLPKVPAPAPAQSWESGVECGVWRR